MFEWLAFGWNLAMIVSASFLVSQTFRSWPLRWTRRGALMHMLMSVATAYVLKAYPLPVVLPGGPDWAGHFADLRFVPILSVLLAYGPLWGGLSALLIMLPELILSVLLRQPGLVTAPMLSSVGMLLVGAVLGRPLTMTRFDVRQAAWRLPLMLLPVGLPFLLRPGGWVGLVAAALLLVGNLLGFAAAAVVNRSRLRLLAVSARLSRQAHTDALTGLWNRRQFESDLLELPPDGWLLIADLDHFKTINDRFGHDVGDEYLIGAAAALQRSFVHRERAYRLGGEEFAVLLPGVTSGEVAGAAAQRVLGHMRQVSHRSSPGSQLSCSIGLAQRKAGETPHAALRRADLALFRAKAAGRGRAERADAANSEPSLPAAEGPRPLEPLVWEALHSSVGLAALDRDLTKAEWTRLLHIAIMSVPHAELGSIDVRDGNFFVQRAQVGFSDALTGLRFTAAEQLHWYGMGEWAWRHGQPRILAGPAIHVHSSAHTVEGNHATMFEEAGRIHELKVTLCIPLLMDGEVVAHLNLDRSSDDQPFDEQDLRIARAFADQVTLLTVAARRRAELRSRALYGPTSPERTERAAEAALS